MQDQESFFLTSGNVNGGGGGKLQNRKTLFLTSGTVYGLRGGRLQNQPAPPKRREEKAAPPDAFPSSFVGVVPVAPLGLLPSPLVWCWCSFPSSSLSTVIKHFVLRKNAKQTRTNEKGDPTRGQEKAAPPKRREEKAAPPKRGNQAPPPQRRRVDHQFTLSLSPFFGADAFSFLLLGGTK